MQEIRQMVETRCLTEVSQICHGTNNKTLCRGARDLQLQFFFRLRVIKEPTDKAWQETQNKLKGIV